MNKPPLPRVLTLQEAAQAIGERAGRTWTVAEVIGCAERGEISILAPWSRSVRLVRYKVLPGKKNELSTVVNAWSPIPQSAARSLLVTRSRAQFTAMPGLVESPFDVDEGGRPRLVPGEEWILADGEEPPEFRLEDCRVYDHAVTQVVERAGGAAPIAAVSKPLQRQRAQEAAILAKLIDLGHNPEALPVAAAGKPSAAKQAVRAALPSYSRDVMDKAWLRLRAAGRIKDA